MGKTRAEPLLHELDDAIRDELGHAGPRKARGCPNPSRASPRRRDGAPAPKPLLDEFDDIIGNAFGHLLPRIVLPLLGPCPLALPTRGGWHPGDAHYQFRQAVTHSVRASPSTYSVKREDEAHRDSVPQANPGLPERFQRTQPRAHHQPGLRRQCARQWRLQPQS